MSRIVIFDASNRSAGEFAGRISRGWAITGNPNVRGGGETGVVISAAIAAKPWIQFGRMVMVQQDKLPAWAGMIDPEWDCQAPVEMSVYNIEYLLSLRTPDEVVKFTGNTAAIVGKIIELINSQEELYLRLGRTDRDHSREETLDRRPFWEQLKALIERAGMEMVLRPEVENSRLIIYMDIQTRLGKNTNYEYKDGENGNMTVTGARVIKPAWNRVIAINDAASEESRLQTKPFVDAESVRKYRLRSRVVQFRGVTELSTLEQHAQTYLDENSRPWLVLNVAIKDKGNAFINARLGNEAIFHAANIRLPGNIHGWRGSARILAMAYDEPTHTLGLTVAGRYDQ